MAFPVFRVVDALVPAAEAEGPAVAEVAVGGEGAEPADGQASLAKTAPAGALAAGDGERENFHRSALAPPATCGTAEPGARPPRTHRSQPQITTLPCPWGPRGH